MLAVDNGQDGSLEFFDDNDFTVTMNLLEVASELDSLISFRGSNRAHSTLLIELNVVGLRIAAKVELASGAFFSKVLDSSCFHSGSRNRSDHRESLSSSSGDVKGLETSIDHALSFNLRSVGINRLLAQFLTTRVDKAAISFLRFVLNHLAVLLVVGGAYGLRAVRVGGSNGLLALFFTTRVVKAAISFLGFVLNHLAAVFGGSAFDNGALRVGGLSNIISCNHNLECLLFEGSINVFLGDLAGRNEGNLRFRSNSRSFTSLRIELHGRVLRVAVNVESVSRALSSHFSYEVKLVSSGHLDGDGNCNRCSVSGLHFN